MDALNPVKKMIVSRFDEEQKRFYLKLDEEEAADIMTVSCNIKLRPTAGGEGRAVNTGFSAADYTIYKFANPYLNAQNDLFKIVYLETTIGFIIPFAAIEQDNEIPDEDFNEFRQAYKYYCVKAIIESFDFANITNGANLSFSHLVHKDCIFAIFYNRLINETRFDFENCLPSFALRGYYYFPDNVKPNVVEFTSDKGDANELNELIQTRFLENRNNDSIHIKKSKENINDYSLLKHLYTKMLVEINNPLHRFLVLYQVIEMFVDKNIRKSIDSICREKDNISNYDFFQKLNEINNTRNKINILFNFINFEEKDEITNVLRTFIQGLNPLYSKQSTGDCFYDIRNLLFHDFKRVMEKTQNSEIIGIVIQCEILIHNLTASIELNQEEAAAPLPPNIDADLQPNNEN